MKRFTMFACLALTVVFAMNAFATDLPQRMDGHDGVFHGGNADFAKAGRDTVFLIGPYGSGAAVNGQFEDLSGNPAWNGWTHYDVTQPTVTHWQVSDYQADVLPGGAGNLAAYCGDATFDVCAVDDTIGGYGNNWHDILRFEYQVADNALNCTVAVDGVFSHNTEPGYDTTTFRFNTADAPVVQGVFDDAGVALPFAYSLSYGTADYMGENSDLVQFDIVVRSDGGWSDEDCDYYGNGACQIDDLHVTVSNGGYDATTDFEDGTYGDWIIAFPDGVGDFTGLWSGLEDGDPCTTNYTAQVAFIDDGTQVPGVGPSYCLNWCYGPGGYIVNTTGGASEDGTLLIELESPVVTWPGAEYIGAEFTFSAYRHEDLSDDSPGMFYSWNVRSTDDEVVSPIADAGWLSRNFVYYGGPDYIRGGDVVSDLIGAGATHAQVQLECNELGWAWGWEGDDGFPAPYFDNVRLTAYTAFGPGMSTRELDISNDNFSEIGVAVDLNDLAANHVRFDMSNTPALQAELNNTPGDSIVCEVVSVRSGGVLVYNRLYYSMYRNPVFDSVRDPLYAAAGFVDGEEVSIGKFAYDLPDTGFLFPGDILHYYFESADEAAGVQESATVPADISGFANFTDPQAYDTTFQVHALPSVKADGSQPGILFWNDFGDRGGENEWYGALNNLGLTMGLDYDVYFTNAPSSSVGNGLGGRAKVGNVDGYSEMLYTSGNLGVTTISNGDFSNDGGDDIGLINGWLATGDRDMFLTGDELVSDMRQSGTATSLFTTDYMNVIWRGESVRALINSQTTPKVLPVAGNGVFTTTPGWIAYGGCFGINTFDAVEAGVGAVRLAQFANPSGAADYIYSAATLNINGDDRVITMPYDFMFIYTDADNLVGNGLATRVNVLGEILGYFNVDGSGWIESGVTPDAGKFFATNYPNPFNPTTKIMFNMPKEGHLTLKIYNVRGELVKTLIDETRVAGEGHIMWDGTNSQGSSVSSGVYFYEARTAGDVQVNKMALVK